MKAPRKRETLFCITIGEQGNIEAYDMHTGEVVGDPTRRIVRRKYSRLANSRAGTATAQRRAKGRRQGDDAKS